MTENKRPKIKDVAKYAGVSEASVSVVLNGRVGENVRVSEATQLKIWDAVRALGYVANPVAQSLAGGQNHIIAVFTFESVFPMDVSSFYYPFLIGIEQEADEQGYDLLLITGSADSVSGRRRIYEQNFNRLSRADGAILLGHGDKDEVYQLLEDGFPFVYVGRRESPQDKISYVAADYVSATEQIVEYLVENGHRRLAYIRTSRHNEASMDRLIGYQQAIQKFHIASTSTASWSGEIQDFTAELMSDYLRSGVTAFVVEDDALGQRLLEVARQLSLQCPRDFSLAVLGNPLNPMQVLPDWTSFNIPRREMGREALCLLVELLSKSNEEKILPLRKILPCTFVSGTTTGPVP
jgi:DNA-binding LacI/PurR family transcriptional regulator